MASNVDTTKPHVSVAIVGHVDSGKSTTTGHLLAKLGVIPQRELDKLKAEADARGKSSFYYAYVTDTSKQERERGVTIHCTTKEFFTDAYHYTVVDAPGHRDFVKNMISGASTVDCAVLMVPADGGFAVAVRKGDRKAKEIEGQSRQHALLLNLLGIKQLVVCVNKMDEGTVAYKQARFDEIKAEVCDMLVRIGWPKQFVQSSVAVIPISGFNGDNLLEKSSNMPWWNGVDVKNLNGDTVHVDTLYDALDKFTCIPKRVAIGPVRMPVSGVHNIKGVGDIITGRIEQGTIKPNDQIVFIPTNDAMTCGGKVFSIEMHHRQVDNAGPGDNVGLCIKGLTKENKPKVGDIMILSKDQTIKTCKKFTAQVKVLDHPGELKVGYTPIALIRTAKAPVRITTMNWKMGKSTNGVKSENPTTLVAGDAAEVVFTPQLPIIIEEFSKCEGLGRVAIMEGGGVVMLGRVISIEF